MMKMIFGRIFAAALFVLASPVLVSPVLAQSLKTDAVGAWELVSYVSTAADGSKTENFGAAPIGSAIFDDKGNFTIIIVKSGLPKFASGNREKGTPEENMAVVQGSIAYFGKYTLGEDGFVFNIAAATLPNWIGSTQKRGAQMPSVNELTLINATASGGGSAEVKFKRRM
jgi:hypothetical protein